MRALPVTFATLLAFTACSSVDAGDPQLDASAKADGLSKAIAYGDTVTGSVHGEAFMLYSLSVEQGDEFEIEVSRTTGSFEPRTVAYDRGLDPIGHIPGSFQFTGSGNIKTFTDDGNGISFLVVRANQSQGSGDYSMSLRCVAGPCAEPPAPTSENTELGICMTRARDCAMAALDTTAPADTDEALDLVRGCLAQDTTFASCATACDVSGPEFGPDELCEMIADALVYYGEQDDTCRTYVNNCLDDCTYFEENSPHLDLDPNEFEFYMTGEASCWVNEFGESCDEVARRHEDCGGSDYRDIDGVPTAGTCFVEWRSTQGAWLEFEDDNIDCFDTCAAAEDTCDAQCSTDSCYNNCLDNSPLLADDFSSQCQ